MRTFTQFYKMNKMQKDFDKFIFNRKVTKENV